MKKHLTLPLLLFVFLCGCQRDLPLESTISLEVDFPTKALKEIAFSEWSMDDYRFETTCNVLTDGAYTRYSGEITNENIKAQLWEILCKQEKMDLYHGGSWDGGNVLKLTNKRTGETFTAGYTIWYAQPDHEGGPTCFVISGSSCGAACYYPLDDGEDWDVCVSEQFEKLLAEGVKTEETITANAILRN